MLLRCQLSLKMSYFFLEIDQLLRILVTLLLSFGFEVSYLLFKVMYF